MRHFRASYANTEVLSPVAFVCVQFSGYCAIFDIYSSQNENILSVTRITAIHELLRDLDT